jgi:hypothetical protein
VSQHYQGNNRITKSQKKGKKRNTQELNGVRSGQKQAKQGPSRHAGSSSPMILGAAHDSASKDKSQQEAKAKAKGKSRHLACPSSRGPLSLVIEP